MGARRDFTLRVGQPDHFAELFDSYSPNDLAYSSLDFRPNGSVGFYSVCREAASAFPSDPSGGMFQPIQSPIKYVSNGFIRLP